MTGTRLSSLSIVPAVLAFFALATAAAVSANFILMAVVLDAGGGSASSSSYTLQGASIGQPFGSVVSTSASYSLIQGASSSEPDFDGDGIPDSLDPDIDNDTLPNTWELANGLSPYNAADAGLDSDTDGRSNLDEYLDGGNPQAADTGDVNGDGSASLGDLLVALQHALQLQTLDETAISRGDFNRDGELTLYDLLALERQLLGQ